MRQGPQVRTGTWLQEDKVFVHEAPPQPGKAYGAPDLGYTLPVKWHKRTFAVFSSKGRHGS